MPTLSEIAAALDGELSGSADLALTQLSPFDNAQPGSLTVAYDEKALAVVETGTAAAVVVPRNLSPSKPSIAVENPRAAMLQLLHLFAPDDIWEPGVHPSASIHSGAAVAADASVGAFAVVEQGATIGSRSRIGAHSIVGAQCQVGEDVLLHANVTLYPRVIVGNGVVIHSGAIIGGNGFGFYEDDGAFVRVPQNGSVVLEDYVEIGCNTCVDRATLDYTRIGKGCKLDNLVQVAHNCKIGEHGRLASQAGIAGSTSIGRRVLMGGQVGIGDHLELGDDITLAGQTGVIGNMDQAGQFMGTPPVPIREFYKVAAALRRLPDLLKRVARLEKAE